jgi:F-type H+-transporting ATPase subunit delta
MPETKISNRYAEALMQQAIADNKLSAVADNMATISATTRSSKDLSNVLSNPIINKQQKQNALLAVFAGLDPMVLNFIKLVSSRNRESILQDIADAFLALYRVNQGIEKVTVQSAVPISEHDEQSIKQYIKQKTGAKTIELHSEINPSVIGGLVIKFGDNLLDTSIAGKLRKLKKELNIA